ncbi:ribonucleotide reductase [Acetivibrio straminisolvens JCM 21531]|uniref:Ribonucleotide reductase n=1 Tax=Acetivibrio straminisolvens JCM 21531 TaxID=1294263 RepID=W4VBD7_9FIRM|nr:ribonucleotide reductase [Acetivibrio straminisolvens JCM 21531]
MITKIRKRDGREVPFNIEKITNAIFKATRAEGEENYAQAMVLAEKVVEQLHEEMDRKVPGVEEIQDIVERVLIKEGHARTAKEYILYRAERTRVREMNTRLMKIYEELTFKESKDNDLKRENANIDGDTAMGTMLKYGSEGAKQFCEMYILKPEHAKAHKDGDIHIHDLDFLTLTTTCCQIDVLKLFKDGFSTGHGHLREPNDIHSYSALACIAIQSNQNDQHGGQSIPNFDYGMAPGVAKTYSRLYKQNLAKALELLSGNKDASALVNTVSNRIAEEDKVYPTLVPNERYVELERKYLMEFIPNADIVYKAQTFAVENAQAETDRNTYQAMEAFIHNLNTMHSRAGRRYLSAP